MRALTWNCRNVMKWTLAAACVAVLSVGSADAKGCIKSAVFGGGVGDMAEHGTAGAAAGCVIGHHEADKPDPPGDAR